MHALSADRDLLLGVLALQLNLVSRDDLLAAVKEWSRHPDQPLAPALTNLDAFRGDAGAALHTLALKYLASHGHDVRKALASLPAFAAFLLELGGVGDPDFLDTLSLGAVEPSVDDPLVTRVPPAGDGTAAGTPTATAARFRILKPHAKGGLGLVYLARDEELRRDVALKEIQPQFADQPDSRARFLLEAEVTGGLEHPGVIPVYGLGTYADGRPFYAMRFIKGDSLKEAIEQFHAETVPPGAHNLNLRKLLGRFIDVCNVLAYAHSRGVLHRDVKPANVMLGPYGETLVVDWGLAKALGERQSSTEFAEQTLHPSTEGDSTATELGKVVGTPAYMSPEQAAGQTDTLGPAGDVYSLGATLYHLLTGRAAFADHGLATLLRRVQSGDFPRPRQVKPGVPLALEAVCLKAMALKPQDRYASAKELAEDVEHWLADEPVKAWREPAAARAGRWLRRHRTLVVSGVAALAVAALLLAGATALLSLAYDREHEAKGHETAARLAAQAAEHQEALARAAAETARGAAQVQRDEALRQQARADDNFAKAKKAVEDYLARVADHPKLKEHGFFDLRRELLKTAVPFFDEFVKQRADDPKLEAERGRAYWRLALLRATLGETDLARKDYERAVRIFARLADAHPAEPEYRQLLAKGHNNHGILLKALGKRDEAEKSYRTAIKLQKELADAHPAVAAYRQEMALSHNNLANLLNAWGKRDEAEQSYRAAVKLQKALVDANPADPKIRRELAATHNNLGVMLFELNRKAEAEDSYREAVRLFQAVADFLPGVPEYRHGLARSHDNLAGLLRELGKRDEAEKSYQAALKLQKGLADEFPSVPDYRRELARTHNNLGLLCYDQGKRDDAAAAYREALKLYQALADGNPGVPAYRYEMAFGQHNLGLLLIDLGKSKEAEAAFREAIQLRKALADGAPAVPAYRHELARSHLNLGELLLKDNRPPAALPELDRAVALLERLAVEKHLIEPGRALLGSAYAGRAEALERLKRRPDAAKDWQRALEHLPPEEHGPLQLRKAMALARVGEHALAATEAEAFLKDGPPDESLYNVACVFALSSAVAQKDAKLREKYARRAVALLRQAHEAGYFRESERVAQLKKDADLEPLRRRDDFRKLLARIEQTP